MSKVKHKEVLDWIILFIEEHGYAPVFREIAAGLGIGATTAFEYLRDMKKLGMIDYKDESPRTITVPGYRFMKVS